MGLTWTTKRFCNCFIALQGTKKHLLSPLGLSYLTLFQIATLVLPWVLQDSSKKQGGTVVWSQAMCPVLFWPSVGQKSNRMRCSVLRVPCGAWQDYPAHRIGGWECSGNISYWEKWTAKLLTGFYWTCANWNLADVFWVTKFGQIFTRMT